MGTFKIGVDDAGLQRKLNALQAAADDRVGLYQAIGSALRTRIQLCFKLGIDPWGNPWRPIKFRAPAGSNDKRGRFKPTKKGAGQIAANASGKAGQPLVNTGAFRNSITSKPDAQGVTIGTNKVQARVHQFGAVIGPKGGGRLVFPGPNGAIVFAKTVTIPARPYLPLRRNDLVELPPSWSAIVRDRIRAHLLRGIDKK